MIAAIESAKQAKRVLVIKTSSLGDVCNALPVADVIHQARPTGHIGWVIKEPYRILIDSNPNVDTTFTFARGDLWSAIKAGLDARKVKYDLALDLQSLFISSLIARLSGAKTRIGYDTHKECSHWFLNYAVVGASKLDRIASELMLDFPRAMGIENVSFRPQKWLGTARRVESDALMTIVPKPYACIYVGATLPQRQWSYERFGMLADRLNLEGLTPVFVGSNSDQAATVSARNIAKRTTYSVVGRTDLLSLAAILAGAAVVVAGDSDLLHLAAAVGTPAVGLYGPTDPVTAGPAGEMAKTIYIKQTCSPCNRAPTCGGAFFCMAAIETEMVMKQVLSAAGRA
jgi:heptosyltransferase-1